ncbi:MAG: pilus assembly protein PilY [Burkholderiales bacterium]|nr:pilus assembly protein PilY [Burkholderiales bacterium]MDE1928352.1 pilus assembly protein PilY [Burkholderiales bacterium]MDE2157768.1 pilus assembly protein PilY [Burkholderiales bacterium]MDE2502162.1 pilus assembly protein PilY [Burkholderiales bacterium]
MPRCPSLILAAAALVSAGASAQQAPVADNFSGATNSLSWTALYGACLTAGTSAGNVGGQIPSCSWINSQYNSTTSPYRHSVGGATGALPDAVGSGALRFTSAKYGGSGIYQQRGAIVSNFSFPSSQGMTVTFRTIAYGGDSGNVDGADGISFFLTDASKSNPGAANAIPSVGATGGSLGYSCTNEGGNASAAHSADGVYGAYLGVGIDEYGNFLNAGDNTATGNGFQAMRIGVRAGGNVNWKWLNANYPALYPSNWVGTSNQYNAVLATCKNGVIWDYANNRAYQPNEANVGVLDYPYVNGANSVLPATKPMATESAATRGAAVPIDYQLTITPNGLLSLDYSYNYGAYVNVINGVSITAINGGALPQNLGFGFSGSTGGSTNIHEILCFKTAPMAQAAGSASLNAQQSGQLQINTAAYLSFYHPVGWWGQLTSNPLLLNTTTNTVSIQSTPTWDASCVLTGGDCASTGVAGMTAQGSANRTILSWNGSVGIPFNNLAAGNEYNALGGGAGYPGWSPTEAVELDYLRGGRSHEASSGNAGGTLRVRNGVLGDIVHSSPAWVGPPSLGYGTRFIDNLYHTVGSESSYVAYKNGSAATRTNLVYAGANDGMLHGFRAGALTATGAANAAVPNDGRELIAYVPGYTAGVGTPVTGASATPNCPAAPGTGGALTCIDSTNPLLNYSNTQYGHNFYVDGQIGTGDLYYNGAWHTWLVAGLGRGGPAVFALDVTNPDNFSEANAASLVMGEWGTSLACSGNASCGQNLGQVLDQPLIRRLHDGHWAIIFGNGVGSATGKAGIYILEVDPGTGALATAYYLDTGVGSTASPNGIAAVRSADLDGDHITDYVYAGDRRGNVWRFDLTSATASNWGVSNYGGGAAATPLFSTNAGHNASVQPITTAPTVVGIPGDGGLLRWVIAFGTGQETSFSDTTATSYATGRQSLYGIWDWNMAHWNTLAANSINLKTFMSSPSNPAQAAPAATLVQQTLSDVAATSTRNLTTITMCWYGSISCSAAGKNYGWEVDLPDAGEQVIYDPAVLLGNFVVNTTVPPVLSVYSCGAATPTGWTVAINLANGGAVTSAQNFFSQSSTPTSALLLNAVGTPTIVSAGTGSKQWPYLVSQKVGGGGVVQQINPSGVGQRASWLQLR